MSQTANPALVARPALVTWALRAVSNPMGQQNAESQLIDGLRQVADPAQWHFREQRMRSLRSTLPGARRFPVGVMERAPWWAAVALGMAAYPGGGLVHRFDLRLPPARREVLTIMDLAPLRFPDEGSIPPSAAAGARRALTVICPSAFAAGEVTELLGVSAERIVVVPNGLGPGHAEHKPLDRHELAGLGVPGPYILHAGGASQRKDLAGLAGAWAALAARWPDLSLVLCGPPDQRRDRCFEGLARVVRLGRVEPDSKLSSLMAGAAVIVVPSRYEGFGLPALEGMASGTPVVAANAGSLPEVCGDAALLVEPGPEALAAGVETVLSDQALAARLARQGPLRAKSFTWAEAARSHMAVYAQALA